MRKVTNYVKVWDSYSKTCINKGSASRAYLVGNDPPERNDSKHHLYNDRDFNGIRCDTKGKGKIINKYSRTGTNHKA